MDELEQETVVPLSVQVQPVGTVSDEKVTSAGTFVKESTAVTEVAVAGPLLVTTAVYVMLEPARTEVGVALNVTAVSACAAG
jgi:hypothetical protein